MSSDVALSRRMFESLVKNLVDVGESKKRILQEYFPEPSAERREFEKLVDEYTRHVDRLISQARISDAAGEGFPAVIIGSEVEVFDVDREETFRFRLVGPFQLDVGGMDVSYLSPVGRSLLLKKVGDRVVVRAPGGTYRYEVRSIKFTGSVEEPSPA